jgi:mono/diheme cytochrome c family protein
MRSSSVSGFLLSVLLAATAAPLASAAVPAPVAPEGAAAKPRKLESTDEMVARRVDFGPRDKMPGAAVFAERCAACHNGAVPKAPHLFWLEMMSPQAILRALDGGVMQAQAAGLSAEQKRHVAEYITREPADGPERTASAGVPVSVALGCSSIFRDQTSSPVSMFTAYRRATMSPKKARGTLGVSAPCQEVRTMPVRTSAPA